MTRVAVSKIGYSKGSVDVSLRTKISNLALEEVGIASSLYIPKARFSTVNAAITSKDKIYSAHRGGSADYPEHTLRGYTQSAIESFGFLEWSSQRTLDGVYVGCHNSNINEVVFRSTALGNTSTVYPAVAEMTWDQIRVLQVKPTAARPDRPPEFFMRLDELFDRYGSTHLVMFDPKSISSVYKAELIAYLDSHGGADRIMTKWVGASHWLLDNTGGILGTKARGYKHWTAVYDSDWTPGTAPLGASFNAVADMWGLNHAASQAHFTDLLATGKRVLGHVCANQAAVTSAISKGATGAQVSGIDSVSTSPL